MKYDVKRKICVVTGSRAEYGHLYWIIKEIFDDPSLKLQLVVTGMHLMTEFGSTIKEIRKDKIPIAGKVRMLIQSDTEKAVTVSIGTGIIGFSKIYEQLKPDVIVVLGDRFEIFSSVAAAVPFRIPIAHIHGGEITLGAMDEQFRHAITKMSHIHFPATKEYAKRIIQMGEAPENVFCCGTPGLDNIYKLNLLNRSHLLKELGLNTDKQLGVMTYHPVTLEKNMAKIQIKEILNAIDVFDDIYWIFTMPNADTERSEIIKAINFYIHKNPSRGKLFSSLGQLKYLSLLKHSVVMVGNSSSGIIEAPSFKLPVVNIGERQKGRIKAKNVINVVKVIKTEIAEAIKKVCSEKFRSTLKSMKNPYGNGNASAKIVRIFKTISLDDKVKKKFYDLGKVING